MSGQRISWSLVSVVALTLVSTVPLCAQSARGGEGPFAQADAFLTAARQAMAAGSASQAASLAASALQLAPDYAEALYVRGRLELADRSTTLAAISDLDQALKAGSWRSTDPEEVRQVLAEALLRTGHVQQAIALLRPLSAAHPESSRLMVLLARAYARAGETRAEQAVLSQAEDLFPLVDDLTVLQAALLERQGRKAAARQTVADALRARPDSLPLLLQVARLAPSAKGRLAAVDAYSQKGGKDPLAAVIALESSPPSPSKYLSLFLDEGGLGRQDLTSRAAAALGGSRAASDTLKTALASYSGNRDLDADGDGFWEERWSFTDGSPVQWIRDSSEDGVPEHVAGFSGGSVATLSYRPDPGRTVTLRFGPYPFVETARAAEASGTRLYSLLPHTIQAGFLQSVPSGPIRGLAPAVSTRVRLPTMDQIARGSYQVVDLGADGETRLRTTSLDHGRDVYLEEDTNGDGVVDHKVWFQAGKPVRGERSLDGGLTFAVRETWSGGVLASQTIDTDGDGKADFRQSFGAVPSKSWDFNEDGTDDSRESPGPGGTTIREFSTRLNGVFDLRVVFAGAKIAQVTRSGSRFGVTNDPRRGVAWIGPPAPADVSVDLSLADGMHILGGERFLSFTYAGVRYMEEIP